MVRKLSLSIIILLLMAGLAAAYDVPEGYQEVFTMWDPRGDALGPGNYQYPQHHSFPAELPQMLDLTGFRVFNAENKVRFEFHFAQAPDLHRPWGGAGYNFHRIDLYIVTGEAGGRTETFRPGAQVEFARPWHINLRIRDWHGSYLIHWKQHNPDDPRAGVWQDQVEGFNVFVEGTKIVAEVNQTLLGPATPDWQYYVLVGIQDAYGPDQYREVTRDGGPWTGGGGCDSEFNPNVYDILAPSVESQQAQLSWQVGQRATLQPVGPRTNVDLVWQVVKVVGVVLLAAGLAVLVWIAARR